MNQLRGALPQSLGPAHYLAAAVLLIRLVVLMRLSGSEAVLPTSGDMQFYDQWAQRIARGEWTDGHAFYGLPLYPYLLALFYSAFGPNPFPPLLLQLCLDTATAMILYKLAVQVFREANGAASRRAQVIGIAAALSWALFLPAQAFSVVLMPTVLAAFAFWWIVWRVVRREGPPSSTEAVLLGFVIGLSAMAVATILFLIPLVMAAVFLKDAKTPGSVRRPVAALLLLLGVGVGTSPTWLHNALVARDPVFLSAHGGVNSWIGNNPDATGYPTFPSGLRAGQATMLLDSIQIAETAMGKPLKRSEVATYWSAQARSYITAEPVAALRLLLVKVHNFWNAFSYDDVSIVEKLREAGALLPGPRFGVIAALALPGVFLSFGRFPAARWIAGAIALHMMAVLPVFVTERYRLAAVPGLLLFALAGLWMLWEAIVRREHIRSALYVVMLLVASLWISMPPARAELWALDFYHRGTRAFERQEFAKAREQLMLARAYSPKNVEVEFALGNVALAQQRIAEARERYRAVLAADPRHQGALNNLGFVALEARDFPLAVQCFSQAAHQEPNTAKSHYLLARALLGLGNREAARHHNDHALNLMPEQAEFRALAEELR